MRRIPSTMAAACAALALTAGVATAQTEPPDRKTFVTFSGPVSVPGMTLAGGTYTFKLLDSDTDRHVVQIFDRDGMKLLTTLLAIPAERREPTGDPVITFKETPSDRPPALHYWYYAGDLAGNEFVYPKAQAQAIANASNESVMAVETAGTSIDEWKSGSMARVTPGTSADTAAAQPPAETAPPAPTPAAPAAAPPPAVTTPPAEPARPTDYSAPPTTAPAPAPASPTPTAASETGATAVGTSGRHRGRLPKTASELPMVGLIGLIALGGALALRVARTA